MSVVKKYLFFFIFFSFFIFFLNVVCLHVFWSVCVCVVLLWMCVCVRNIFLNPFNFGDATNASIDKVNGFSSTNFVKFEFHSEFALDVIVNISAFLQ